MSSFLNVALLIFLLLWLCCCLGKAALVSFRANLLVADFWLVGADSTGAADSVDAASFAGNEEVAARFRLNLSGFRRCEGAK